MREVKGYIRAQVYQGHPGYEFANPRITRHEHEGRYRLIQEHRLVMSMSLGRKLLSTETVHHLDGDPKNNALKNLQLRHGSHGPGARIICADCGSHNTKAIELP